MSLRMKDIIVTFLLIIAPTGWNTATADASSISKITTCPSKKAVITRNTGKPVKSNVIHQPISTPPKEHDFTKIPPGASYVPGELLVHFAPRDDGTQRSVAEKEQVIRRLGGRIVEHYNLIPGLVLVALLPGQTVQSALIIYNSTREILYAEPNYIRSIPEQIPGPEPEPKKTPAQKRPTVLRDQSSRLRPVHSNRTRKTVPLSRLRSR